MKHFMMGIAATGVAATTAFAGHPVVQPLGDLPIEPLLAVENGAVESVTIDGQPAWRWTINEGQTSLLSIRPEHPLFDTLRYYDRLQLAFRIAEGEISSLVLNTLGQVAGPRQYKVHNFRLGLTTTPRQVWQDTELDLARPYWFPWDNADGGGERGYFRFEAMALASNTVVEIRQPRLVRGLIYIKPDYERPITWPVKTNNADGSVSYSLAFKVLNSSGQPADITARVTSAHKAFSLALNTNRQSVKAGGVADFDLTATLSKAALDSARELDSEPLALEFAAAHRPDATALWFGRLVRPLTPGFRKQVVVSDADIRLLREKLAEPDAAAFKTLIGYTPTLAKADEFVGKTLQTIPQSYNHVPNRYPGAWKPGNIMSEAVNKETGERRIGDALAGEVWRQYLGSTGKAPFHAGLAYLMTGDETYARKAIELMRLYAQQYAERKWHAIYDVPFFPGAAIQSSARLASNSSYGTNWDLKWFCEMASMVADSPSWTPEDRALIYHGFVLPYATELLKLNAQISNMTDITNHNLLLLGLAFDDALLVYQATLRDCGLLTRLQDIDADGFSSEGRPLNYHHAAADEYLPSITYLAHSGLALDYKLERVLAAIRMPYERATLTGLVPNTGDCGKGQAVGPSRLADILAGVATNEAWLLDIGSGSTLAAQLHSLRTGRQPDRNGWRNLLNPRPHLFAEAGLAILRSGDTPDSQVMLTLDYGRNVFHGALDRNQITLWAFGKVFTHGPGSLYNAGRGIIQYNEDPRLKSFNNGTVSLANNVLVVDRQSQLSATGELLAWSDKPDWQVAVSRVDGIAPGLSHTRGVLLTRGVILLFDRVRSDTPHVYDLVYHNFGEFKAGEGWTAGPLAAPLGDTGNYGNLIDPARLTGPGLFRATWDLSGQQRFSEPPATNPPPLRLAFWQHTVNGGEIYRATTGLNNPNTVIMSDVAPSVIQRATTNNLDVVTVLEPFKDAPRVVSVASDDGSDVTVKLNDGTTIHTSLDELIRGASR